MTLMTDNEEIFIPDVPVFTVGRIQRHPNQITSIAQLKCGKPYLYCRKHTDGVYVMAFRLLGIHDDYLDVLWIYPIGVVPKRAQLAACRCGLVPYSNGQWEAINFLVPTLEG